MASRPCTTFPTHSGDGTTFEDVSTVSQQSNTTDDQDRPTSTVTTEQEEKPSSRVHGNDRTGIHNILSLVHSPQGYAREKPTSTNKPHQAIQDDPLIRPPRLPVVFQSRSKDSSKTSGNAAFHVSVKHENPDQWYEPILYLGNKKSTITVLSRSHPFRSIRAIKKRCIPKASQPPDLIRHLSHENIVNVLEAFYHGGCIFTVSECLDLSLQSLEAVPIAIQENHIASIALQVLRGLNCIEEAFQKRHGCINPRRILFASNGSVKIDASNVANALQRNDPHGVDADTKVLGQLLENLRVEWSLQARAFFDATRELSCQELLKYHFVKKAPAPSCLRRYISIAAVAVIKPWGLADKISSES
ncbi:hypothetical protein B0J12DRAFT_732004 [Macrophomina phaseolina]|uniref:Protein kinase domain-containing protein n=1 Tax=Macrophomina phaseolina TaxID=35725 RepID=A0ABQ8G062_9PEZI|nr:hypothetical protein B0J12DRAFT_732004 [Macrophomina phaseolina]